MRLTKPFVCRLAAYLGGMLLLAVGVVFSVNSNLGVSPANAPSYALSNATPFSMGTCVTGLFSLYVLLQWILLRRRFHPKSLLQILAATLFGYLVDFARFVLGDFAFPTYGGRLLMLAVSIAVIALGMILYLEANLIPMPLEGLTLAVSTVLGKPFHTIKVLLDTSSFVLAAAISLSTVHSIDGLREGTLIAALITGRVMSLFAKPIQPVVHRLCYPQDEQTPAAAAVAESAAS